MSTRTTDITRRVCDYLDFSASIAMKTLVSQINVQHSVERPTWHITLWHGPTSATFTASFTEERVIADGYAACVHDAMKGIEKPFMDYHDRYIERRFAYREKAAKQ